MTIKNTKNTYHFKGETNFELLTNDARQDGLVAFVVIEKDKSYLGLLGTDFVKQITDTTEFSFKGHKLNNSRQVNEYYIFDVTKEETPVAVDIAKYIQSQTEQQQKNTFKSERKELKKAKKKGKKLDTNKVISFEIPNYKTLQFWSEYVDDSNMFVDDSNMLVLG